MIAWTNLTTGSAARKTPSVGRAGPAISVNLRLIVRRMMHGETWRRHWPKGHPLLAPRPFSVLFAHEGEARQECRARQAKACATSGADRLQPRSSPPHGRPPAILAGGHSSGCGPQSCENCCSFLVGRVESIQGRANQSIRPEKKRSAPCRLDLSAPRCPRLLPVPAASCPSDKK